MQQKEVAMNKPQQTVLLNQNKVNTHLAKMGFAWK